MFSIFMLVGSIFLQIHICKTYKSFWRLFLPITSLVFSLFISLNFIVVSTFSGFSFFISLLPLIIVFIPTIISFGIYFYFKKQDKKDDELKKMKIQDLD